MRDLGIFVLGAITACTLIMLTAANWPSTGGSTARGIVIEDGAGNALGTVAHPLVCS